MTFAEFIAQKTIQKISAATGETANTIYSWKHHNRIPRRVWPNIMTAMPEVGLSDLMAMEAARTADHG